MSNQAKRASTRRPAPATPKPPKPVAQPSPAADGLPRQIGGFAILAPHDGSAGQDPVQAAMDAAVLAHNAAERARLAPKA